MVSLKPLISIGGMLLIVLYVYAIASVSIFGTVMKNNTITDNLNFQSFPTAALVLFVIATGDSWNTILQGAVQQPSLFYACTENPTYQDYVANN